MLNTHLRIVQFLSFRARNCCNCLIQVISKFQHHNVQPITLLWEMEMYWILWCIKISDSQMSLSDILDSDHLSIMFHILDHIRTKQISKPLEKFTDWEWFQSLASNLISPRVDINSGIEADKAVCAFTASTASAYRLSTSKITLSKLNNDLPGLDRLLRYKRRMRKLWQEIQDPRCKTEVNWVS
jgi:hypothetical protein